MNEFLNTLYRLVSEKKNRIALDIVIDFFEDDPTDNDSILLEFDVNRLPTVILLAIVVITKPMKEDLKNWDYFAQLAYETVKSRDGEETANELFRKN